LCVRLIHAGGRAAPTAGRASQYARSGSTAGGWLTSVAMRVASYPSARSVLLALHPLRRGPLLVEGNRGPVHSRALYVSQNEIEEALTPRCLVGGGHGRAGGVSPARRPARRSPREHDPTRPAMLPPSLTSDPACQGVRRRFRRAARAPARALGRSPSVISVVMA
jgi:hypothetical protein